MTLKFYTSVTKGLKLKVKVLGANSNVCRSYRGKTGRGAFLALSSSIGLIKLQACNFVKIETLAQVLSFEF